MKVVVAHNRVSDAGPADEQDVLVQADAVRRALGALGHEVAALPCDLNLARAADALRSHGPALVFNLTESLDGRGRLIHMFPELLDALNIAYTGANADAMRLTSNKVLAKERMAAAGLPTPDWQGPHPPAVPFPLFRGPCAAAENRAWIIKSVWEHASIGLDNDSVIHNPSTEELENAMQRRAPLLGGACFAEAFVAGREFNLAMLSDGDEPEVLPPAEIIFNGFGPSRPRIVGYRAKWEVDSPEYRNTPRRFDFPPEDEALLACLDSLALECWAVFGLRGYARVDFRVDEAGNPWILEINANPCLSPDAGFAAALDRAGISFTEAVRRICHAAHSPHL